MAATAQDLMNALTSYLGSRSLQPSHEWLNAFVASARLSTPLPALQKTVLFRLLASDFTTSLQHGTVSVLPSDSTNVDVKERKLRATIPVQVLDIEDVGRSRWSQVDLLDQQERGEMTKGREIIRLAPETENDGDPMTTRDQQQQTMKSSGPHKILLQDAQGTRIYGFELSSVDGIGLQTAIGAKLLLKDAVIARGVVLLEPRCVEILGGKVESWDQQWRKGRREVLAEKARAGVPS